jgi:hypothetical protein
MSKKDGSVYRLFQGNVLDAVSTVFFNIMAGRKR